MNPASFAYHRADTVGDAIALLQAHGTDAKLIAGGHSLLPIMKLRLAAPEHLIDITRIAGLSGVREEGDSIVIGALSKHRAIEQDALIAAHAPLLTATASTVGDRQVRNRGTFGGALAHADTAADYPAAVLALDATLIAEGPNGRREIPVAGFFIDFLTTALEPEELLVEVRVPKQTGQTGVDYQKLANQASGYAVVGVAAQVTLADDGTIARAALGVTGVTAAAFRATAAETVLTGATPDEATLKRAAAAVAEGLDPLSDIHASADYRLQVLRGLSRRALTAAVANARG